MAKKLENTVDSKLESVAKKLNTKWGPGTIINGKEEGNVQVIPTRSITLDLALGCGGYAVGKLIEIFGPESSGKSTLSLIAIAEAQNKFKNRVAVIVDAEQSLDVKYASSLGIDLDRLIVVQVENQEMAYNVMEEYITTGEVSIIVFDSHTAALPKAVVDAEVGMAVGLGLQARLNSIGVGKVKPLLKKNNCTLIAISQLRTDIGVMYGNPNKSTGGNAFKFYSDVRLSVSKSTDKKNGLDKTKVTVVKNKVGPPFGVAEFSINWGEGIDEVRELLDMAIQFGFIEQGGAGWLTIGDVKIQGLEKMKEFMLDNEDFYKQLKNKVLKGIKK